MSAKVWANSEGFYYKVLAIAKHGITLVDPKEGEVDDVAEALRAGDDEDLPGKVVVISWGSLQSVTSNRKKAEADFHYEAGKETESENFDFPDTETRDECFEFLHDKLGERFDYTEKELTRAEAALKPSAWAAGLAALTFLFYKAAEQIAAGEEVRAGGRRGGLKRLAAWLIELIGTTGVLVIGGICVVIALIALVKRVGDPPIAMKLKRI